MISDVIHVVQGVVESLGIDVPYYAAQSRELTIRIYTKRTLWLKAGDEITVTVGEGTVTFDVSDVSCGLYIEVLKGSTVSLPGNGTFSVTKPLTFKYGTVRRVNNEVIAVNNVPDICPLVYMVEVMSSRQPQSPTTLFSDIADLRLFVLEESHPEDWQTSSEYYQGAINKTDIIAGELITAFKRSPRIGKLTESRTWNHINVGRYSESGGDRNLFDAYFSGTEIRMPLPIIKECC